jgi:hypothetical protein
MKKTLASLADLLFWITGFILLVYIAGFLLWAIGVVFYDTPIVIRNGWLAIVSGMVFLLLLLVRRGVLKK